MPTLIMTSFPKKLDGSVRAKTMTFLEKLSENDTTSGLHIEPINGSVDPRARTGRVDQFWRAVLFRLDGSAERHYVVHGVWPHDDAIEVARRTKLSTNPNNGLPSFEMQAVPGKEVFTPKPPTPPEPAIPFLAALGYSRAELVDRLGLPESIADAAMSAGDEDTVVRLAERNEGWVGLILLDLATGESVESIIEKLQLSKPKSGGDEDDDIIEAFHQPAAQAQFAFIADQDELRRVIEAGDFGAWRIFLHPEQRKYVEKEFSGPFRLSGGAGTGKTVVLVHRARYLASRDPKARIVMTTFTTNLADALRDNLAQLDATVAQAAKLGESGVYESGIDALASAVIKSAGPGISKAVDVVLGEPRSAANGRAPIARWRAVIDAAAGQLPPELANETFLTSEYALVVLPNRVRTEADYLAVRRPGRGVALDRRKRTAVWALFAAYRAQNRADGTLDYAEAAAVAAAWLEADPSRSMADHVLVDEGQDLSPTHWQLLRALVPPGQNDLFIAEDSHQRIYGSRVVLGRYGIAIVGRSQRLTLNYRTTAQNLRYAMTVLEGGNYIDIEDSPEQAAYRSARSGPTPKIETAESLTAELDLISDRTRGWLDDAAAAETIAVLVQDRYQRDRVANRLTELGIQARAVDRERPPAGRVVVMTMHRAKGTEFSKVILADVGYQSPAEKARLDEMEPSEREDALLRTRSLVYVAATRARDELVVIYRE